MVLAALAATFVLPSIANAEVTRVQGGGKLNGRFGVSPDKKEIEVDPGTTQVLRMHLENRTQRTVHVELLPTDIEPTGDESFIRATKGTQFGAGSWLHPEIDQLDMKTGEIVEFDVTITPPVDAPVGTNFGGLIARVAGRSEDKVSYYISALAQIYVTIPGKVKRDTKIVKAEVADSFLFHGSGFITYELTFANDGNVNDHIDGEIVVRSLFGNTVSSLDIRPYLVLRGSKRTVRVIWPKQPRFGRFSAQGRFHSDDRQQLTKDFPNVWISPEWWWYLIVILVLVCPAVYTWHSRRNSWKQYLDDEDWDEEWADDEDWHEDAELT
jgi:hypothetical protein